jgi:DNA-binding NarL/FixJ family response regulator
MRRRLDGDQMMARDREVARLRRQGVSLRGIAERLGMSLGSVRLAVKRTSRRQ